LKDTDLNKRLVEMGFNIVGGKPEILRDLMIAESDKWGRIVKDAKITLN